MKRTLAERVQGKYEATEDGCWEWTASRNEARRGYGQLNVDGRPVMAHRVMYELFVGPIPPGLCVCHHCDNPPCVRPDHLFLGTHGDNAKDRDMKGRTVIVPAWEAMMEQASSRERCRRGHPYRDHGYVSASGRRTCRACRQIRLRAFRERHASRSSLS